MSSVSELDENNQEETQKCGKQNNFKNFDIWASWEMCVLHVGSYTWV